METTLQAIRGLPGITVERCGAWLWISGDTFPIRKELKAAGCFFSHRKGMWYFHEGEYKKVGSREFSMEEIEEKYGYEALI